MFHAIAMQPELRLGTAMLDRLLLIPPWAKVSLAVIFMMAMVSGAREGVVGHSVGHSFFLGLTYWRIVSSAGSESDEAPSSPSPQWAKYDPRFPPPPLPQAPFVNRMSQAAFFLGGHNSSPDE